MKFAAIGCAALVAAFIASQAGSTDSAVTATTGHTSACATVAPAPLAARRFTFPRDDGTHDGFATEWWRTFGRVRDLGGNAYDLSVNVSRFAVNACGVRASANAWAATHLMTSAYEILDERSGRTFRAVHVERDGPLGGTSTKGRLDLAIAGLRLSERPVSGDANVSFHLALRDGKRATIAVDESPKRRPVPLGPNGVMKTGSCAACTAYAYAYTRNFAHGTIAIDGRPFVVAGTMWLEHEFSRRELDNSDIGWDRFDVTFEDGRDLDARFTRNAFANRVVGIAGTLVDADGRITYLDGGNASESAFPSGTHWRSDASGVAYPSAWLLDGRETSDTVQDQEIFAPGRTPYYFGVIDVQGESDSRGAGHGFVELTGYAEPIAL